MSRIILQPSGNKDAREHYDDTILNPVGLNSISNFLSDKEKNIISKIYPNNKLFIWGVTPGGNNISKWNKINQGDVTLFSKDKRIYSSGVTTYKFQNKDLALFLWDKNSKNQTWEYIYLLDEIKTHNIPYLDFKRCIGYKENYVIQGFNVLDKEKSEKVLNRFNLFSDTYIEEIDVSYFNKISLDLDITEQSYTGLRRLEQGFLRKNLFKNHTLFSCCCCKKEYPVSFLVAAHIKKRSHCNNKEKLDENIVIPLCKFGCDELYEKGVLVVQNGEFTSSRKNENENIKLYIDSIKDKRCNYYNTNTSEYFSWHYNFHK